MATVPIPPWNARGLLPGNDASNPVGGYRAPYPAALLDVVMRFGTSGERRQVLHGWLAHRAALHGLGVASGFQWVDGSFVEDVEALRGRPPNDVDVVSFVEVPPTLPPYDEALDHGPTKARYKVDSYFVELNLLPADELAQQAAYWYSVWGHTRAEQWKGFLQVDMAPHEDGAAQAWLDAADAAATGATTP